MKASCSAGSAGESVNGMKMNDIFDGQIFSMSNKVHTDTSLCPTVFVVVCVLPETI